MYSWLLIVLIVFLTLITNENVSFLHVDNVARIGLGPIVAITVIGASCSGWGCCCCSPLLE